MTNIAFGVPGLCERYRSRRQDIRTRHRVSATTMDGGGTRDDLSTPTALRTWLTARGLLPQGAKVTASEHTRVLELRANLRAALDRGRPRAHASTRYAVPLQVQLDPGDGPRLTSADTGVSEAIAEITAAALRTAITGEWWRLRACAADDCQWVFYDRSKPGRGRYCAPDTCGNRVKTRAYRHRKAETDSQRS